MTKFNAEMIVSLFANYDAGTRTKALRTNAALKSVEHCVSLGFINETQFDALSKHAALPTGKVAMLQIAKAIDFIATGDVRSIDKATAAFVTIALLLDSGTDKPQTFENARFTLSAKGSENSRPIDGIKAQSLRKAIGAISNVGTVSAQTSRTVGVNGTMGIMQATRKVSAHEFTVNADARNNPFLLAYGRALSKLPEGVLVAKFMGDEA